MPEHNTVLMVAIALISMDMIQSSLLTEDIEVNLIFLVPYLTIKWLVIDSLIEHFGQSICNNKSLNTVTYFLTVEESL